MYVTDIETNTTSDSGFRPILHGGAAELVQNEISPSVSKLARCRSDHSRPSIIRVSGRDRGSVGAGAPLGCLLYTSDAADE